MTPLLEMAPSLPNARCVIFEGGAMAVSQTRLAKDRAPGLIV